ncbi:hypothetical protein OOJ91_33730 [Micromonospora lupini]|uniref:hypothetical protein n=1 Tax=Micromonospora lupini TaxID=285679 RepID=UPI00225481A4|nr:hypothetical protein [Micromonospora lupini]MCX5070808.1 hypothetical protein [Micromonospora lupini]
MADDTETGTVEGRHASEDEAGLTVVAQAEVFPTRPAGPVQAAPVSAGSKVLGLVWTDGKTAAAWVPTTAGGTDVAAATTYVWQVLQAYKRDGGPAQVLSHPDVYGPAYQLGEAKQYSTPAAAAKALLA